MFFLDNGGKGLIKVQRRTQRSRRVKKRRDTLSGILLFYLRNTTLHCIKYVVDLEMHWIERLIWFVLFISSAGCAIVVIYLLSMRFEEAPTSTVVETTNFKISAVPFPSVTICPTNRVDWEKAIQVESKYVPSHDPETIATFREILTKLSTITFGDFEHLAFLKNRSLRALAGINVTQVLLDVTPNCQDVFSSCWWRTSYRECCEILELQKTEYGFCYSFNSNNSMKFRGTSWNNEDRSKRVTEYGNWSGVRLKVHFGNITQPPDSNNHRGIILSIYQPGAWPNGGHLIANGMAVDVPLRCTSGYATESVLGLGDNRIPCKPGGRNNYNREYCLSMCKRSYVYKYCGCNPSFFFPQDSTNECTIEDFVCLTKHNIMFNTYYDDKDDHTIVDQSHALRCDCPPECEFSSYMTKIIGMPIVERSHIELDIHFESLNCLRYRTDVVYTKLDLLVSFGGIIGLFFGGSLLSAVEILYAILCAIHLYFYRRKKRKSLDGKSGHRVIRRPGISTIVPLIDYPDVRRQFYD